MSLFLYQRHNAPDCRNLSGNAGLYFERFFDRYTDDGSKVPENEKNAWLQQCRGMAGDRDALARAAQARMKLVKQLGGKVLALKLQWHFVSGTGNPHPVENGFSWHPVHGVPYIGGAALKGILRAWVEQWMFSETEQAERDRTLLSWFGSVNKHSPEQHCGDLIFFDALPLEPAQLVVDIMTPHRGKWYAEGGDTVDFNAHPEAAPADWHDPVPIPFLAVSKADFLVCIAPRNEWTAQTINLTKVMDNLSEALDCLGAGAKTAGGYGALVKPEKTPAVMAEWEQSNQNLDEQIAALSEADLILAFSKNINKTKAHYEQKNIAWQEVVALVWHRHGETITSWQASPHENARKAFDKLSKLRDS